MKRAGTVAYHAMLLNPRSPYQTEFIRDGVLVVSGGRIQAYGSRAVIDVPRNAERVRLPDQLIVPGFVDLHTHVAQYGLAVTDAPTLAAWLRHVYRYEAAFNQPRRARHLSQRFFAAITKGGTTTACVNTTLDPEATEIAFQEAEAAGLRVIMGKMMMDLAGPGERFETTDESVEASDRLQRRWHEQDGGRIRYAYSPRSVTCCTLPLLRAIAHRLRRSACYVQTHLAETREELSWVPWAHPPYRRDMDVLARAGLVGHRTIAAHGIHLTPREYEEVRRRGTAIAHCPEANLMLRAGFLPVPQLVKRGLRLGLGTDVGAGRHVSILRTMEQAAWLARARAIAIEDRQASAASQMGAQARVGRERGPPASPVLAPATAFYLATVGGARALGLDAVIGSFAPGKEADFAVLDVEAVTNSGRSRGQDLVDRLVYDAADVEVVATFVRGQRIAGDLAG